MNGSREIEGAVRGLRDLAGRAARGEPLAQLDVSRVAAVAAVHVRGDGRERLLRALTSDRPSSDLAARRRVFHAARALAATLVEHARPASDVG